MSEGSIVAGVLSGYNGNEEKLSQYILHVGVKVYMRHTEPIQTPSMPQRFLRPLHAVSIRCFTQKLLQVIYQTSHFEGLSVLREQILR